MATIFNYIKGKLFFKKRPKSNQLHDKHHIHNSSNLGEKFQSGSNVSIKMRNRKYQQIESVIIDLFNEMNLINQRLDQITTK